MKVIAAPVAEGWYQALVVAFEKRSTRRGVIPFLRCRITSGKDNVKGREVSFIVPRIVNEGTHFHRFLVAVLGSLDVEKDVDPQALVGQAVAIRVAHVRKGKRKFCNVVAVSPPGDVGGQTRRMGHRKGQSAARK